MYIMQKENLITKHQLCKLSMIQLRKYFYYVSTRITFAMAWRILHAQLDLQVKSHV